MATLKILVVDDEIYIRAGINRILRDFKVDYPFMDEAFDFVIDEAESGEVALEKIESNKPDLILLDNKLPGIQGIEVLEYVKKKKLDIVVVMITSFASLDLAVRATQNGAHDFIPKPFTPQELKSAIENITKHVFLVKMTSQMSDQGKQIRFQFLSVLSHELKAPLNAIEGYLRMIREKQLGNNIEDYDQIIDRSMERIKGMRNLIFDLLDMTRMESETREKEITELDLVEYANKSVDTAKPMAIQKDVKFTVNAPEHILFNADSKEVEIIFNNLISNAVKYNRDGGKVDISMSDTDENITIEVKDTGIGMSEEEQQKLFSDFYRIKNSKTRNITGTGLGLSIMKKLVDTYNGTVTVQSTPDVGSTFTVILPKKSEE